MQDFGLFLRIIKFKTDFTLFQALILPILIYFLNISFWKIPKSQMKFLESKILKGDLKQTKI